MPSVATVEHQRRAGLLREAMATYQEARDLINIGAYVRGSNPRIDAAIDAMPRVEAFLRQRPEEQWGFEDTMAAMEAIARELQATGAFVVS
jgi:flagellar biosynthesis/type III secretory pathway ATPase